MVKMVVTLTLGDNILFVIYGKFLFTAHFARMLIDRSTPDSQWFVVGRNYKTSDGNM